MRAAFIRKTGGVDVLEVGEIASPNPGRSEVRVKLKASSLNHLDIWIRRGLPHMRMVFPHILGADGAGIVDKVGSNVKGFKEGDEVIVHPGLSCGECEHCLGYEESLCREYRLLGEHVNGTNAEFVVVPDANLFFKPKELGFEPSAAIPLVFSTAWQMLVRKAKVKAGDLVLIHAAGSGVSSAAIQIATSFGAEVVATAGTEEKLALARGLGAKHTVNYKSADFLEATKKISKRGADIIIDHVGQTLWESNIKALRTGGTLVSCGASSGPMAPTDLRHLFFRQLNLLGSTMGSKRDFPVIIRDIASGRMRSVLDKRFTLDDIRLAHEHLESRQSLGKTIVTL